MGRHNPVSVPCIWPRHGPHRKYRLHGFSVVACLFSNNSSTVASASVTAVTCLQSHCVATGVCSCCCNLPMNMSSRSTVLSLSQRVTICSMCTIHRNSMNEDCHVRQTVRLEVGYSFSINWKHSDLRCISIQHAKINIAKYWIHRFEHIWIKSIFYSEAGGSKLFRNVGTLLPNYTASHIRRQCV
jgi:hypothetical protein